MVNRHKSNWSQMGCSRFEFSNDLDVRMEQRKIIYEEFRLRILKDFKNAVSEFAENKDLVRYDSLIEEGLRVIYEEFAGER